jgi:hypothetical protein
MAGNRAWLCINSAAAGRLGRGPRERRVARGLGAQLLTFQLPSCSPATSTSTAPRLTEARGSRSPPAGPPGSGNFDLTPFERNRDCGDLDSLL